MRRAGGNTIGRWAMVLMVGGAAMLSNGACTDGQSEQVRTDMAPAVAGVFGALGELAGAYASGMIRPPAVTEAEPSLK